MSRIEEAKRRIRKCLENLDPYLDLRASMIGDVGFEIPELMECVHLERMNLSCNYISDISFLRRFKNLNVLNLSENSISNISTLRELNSLEHLDLSSNKIGEITELGELQKLKSLIIGGKNLEDISIINELQNLESLELYGISGSSTYQGLTGIQNLNSLSLSGFGPEYVDRNWLSGFPYLRNLGLHFGLCDISFVANLKHLKNLWLDDNRLEDISEISELKSLISLDLTGNFIEDIDSLAKLSELTSLKMGGNRVKSLSSITKLDKLLTLDLRSNAINNISELGHLRNLRSLNISRNKIDDISVLANLTNLISIDLSENNIGDISAVADLVDLKNLNAQSLKLNDISALYRLENIEKLSVGGNSLQDISVLSKMGKLKYINLTNNKISDFSPLLKNENYKNGDFENLFFDFNPISFELQEALKGGYQVLNTFYENLYAEGSILNDHLKVVVLGNSTAGKTSLLNYLGKKEFDQEEVTTHGISRVMDFEFDGIKHVNFWDFGGQDYYHATHRLFITTNSIGIIVCHQDLEDRKVEEETIEYVEVSEGGENKKIGVPVCIKHYPYSYWLKSFAHLTKADTIEDNQYNKRFYSKVFLVENKCAARVSNVDMKLSGEVMKKTPFEVVNNNFFQLDIREAYHYEKGRDTNEQAEDFHFAFRKFERRLKEELQKSFSDNNFKVIANYPVIRDIIASLAESMKDGVGEESLSNLLAELNIPIEFAYEKLPVWITYEEYKGIIRQNSKLFNESTYRFVTTYLRDFCGRILYFEDIESLKDIVFIDPQWLHTRIYLFLNKDFVKERQVNWRGETLTLKQGEFILEEVDKKFEGDYLDALQLLDLMKAFELAFEIPEQNPRRFIAPQYLPGKPPISDAQLNKLKYSYHDLALTLEFGQYLPPSLISRIISQKGHLIKENDEPLWRNGLVYEENGQSTFVLCIPDENKIEVYLKSKYDNTRNILLRDFMVFMEEKYKEELEEMYVRLPNEQGKVKWKDLLIAKREGGNKAKNFDKSFDRELVDSKPFEFLFEKFEREPVRIFLCYSTGDNREKYTLFKKLKPALEAFGKNENVKIELFHDKEMPTGSDWLQTIRENIRSNDILICLLSNDFFNSNFIDMEEHGNVLRDILAEKRNSLIAPIYLKDCQIKEGKHIANFNIWKPDPSEYGLSVSSANFSFSNLIGHANDSYIDNYVNGFVSSISGEILKAARLK
ncbi:MAG: TIR domain-containing protein [Cytophagales bacterium]|nr:TIR domain-containing protein [Cytophagales bacterium]